MVTDTITVVADDRPRASQSSERTRLDAVGAASVGNNQARVVQMPEAVAPEPALPELPAGLRVGAYEVIRELGRGGMGRVVLARDTKLGRRVAMKFLATSSPEHTERFLIEARTTAHLNHENIVVIHEVDEYEGAPYMVLEYLDGVTLRELLNGERMPAGRAVELAVPIVRALVRAHDAGIVHRDLKPENVFVTDAGSIKVLDFGIAKLLAHERHRPGRRARPDSAFDAPHDHGLTSSGALLGTLPYMSPEQLGVGDVDHRADLWALGVMLFEMVTGRHPLPDASTTALIAQVTDLDAPIPAVGASAPDLPERLERAIDRCLAKHVEHRFTSAHELLDALEALLPGRPGRQLADDESPYPGLTAFQETDADRFFGRDHDNARMVVRVREQALVAVVGPSGVGKSSFVRAGVVPALKASGEWEVHVLRPGRQPLAGLAAIIETYTTSPVGAAPDRAELAARLAHEPGYLGAVLRARAARKHTRILVFVDQLEELYTSVADASERIAFTKCLAAAADDPASPVRVVVSMRSDFLDRVGEDPRFLDELTRGLVFLQPLGPPALREALVQPIAMRGYQLETREMVDEMIESLASTPGALPLLQFAAAKLWEARDRQRKLLARASYDAMGGISGALATHADQVLASLAPAAQAHARAVLVRLVTVERTRAIVELRELRELSSEPRAIEAVVDQLIAARLLVVQNLGESAGASVELVHESLIGSWPTLRRWLDEGQSDAIQLAQLRTAAAQWDQKGRIQGLLWRGEALAEARRWHAHYRGELPERERAFLAAVFALGARAARMKRIVVGSVIAFLSLAVAGSAIALVTIRDAEQTAKAEAARATDEQHRAETERTHAQAERTHAQAEAERARQAEHVARDRLDQVKAEQADKERAQGDARAKGAEVTRTQGELEKALANAERARAVAEQEAAKARAAAAAEKQAKDEAQRLYAVEKARREAAEKQRSKITTELSK